MANQTLTALNEQLIGAESASEKFEIFKSTKGFRKLESCEGRLKKIISNASIEEKCVIAAIFTIEQDETIFCNVDDKDFDPEKFRHLLSILVEVENFYQEIGGIVGYHIAVLKLLEEKRRKPDNQADSEIYLTPIGFDLKENVVEQNSYIRWGVEFLPEMAEIYPVGGAGDRLNLKDRETGQPLPAAELNFCGRSLLTSLIRDLQAREYLFYKLKGRQVQTPIALMTSKEKDNHEHILKICEKNRWFGRNKEQFFLFMQPLVPLMTAEGNWLIRQGPELYLKPGGHGMIWKLAKNKGVFQWLSKKKRKKALVRQINNPIAGTDSGLLAFCGIGCKKDKAFGFSSCPRVLNSSQGMLVLKCKTIENLFHYCISNIEYVDFTKKGVDDKPKDKKSAYSKFPANTNILFVDLKKIEDALSVCSHPGLLVNFKTKAPMMDHQNTTKAGRLESTMQNISDYIFDCSDHRLSNEELLKTKAFVTYSPRRKTISVTKKKYDPSEPPEETPLFCFYEMLQNNHELLSRRCEVQLPELNSLQSYLAQGPNMLFLYHPALGPLYSVIDQKIRKGCFQEGAELQLELSEIYLEQIELSGSLLIHAENPLGHTDEQGRVRYSDQSGKCELKNVIIKNKGIDKTKKHSYWENRIQRKEVLHIALMGNAELLAENIVFNGSHHIVVPDGQRWIAEQKGEEVEFIKEKISSPTWRWEYSFQMNDEIQLRRLPLRKKS